jgi:hypothetical protein
VVSFQLSEESGGVARRRLNGALLTRDG